MNKITESKYRHLVKKQLDVYLDSIIPNREEEGLKEYYSFLSKTNETILSGLSFSKGINPDVRISALMILKSSLNMSLQKVYVEHESFIKKHIEIIAKRIKILTQNADKPACIKTHYSLLGIPTNATDDVITKVYLEKYAQVQNSEHTLKELNDAYFCLSSPENRAKYDLKIKQELDQLKKNISYSVEIIDEEPATIVDAKIEKKAIEKENKKNTPINTSVKRYDKEEKSGFEIVLTLTVIFFFLSIFILPFIRKRNIEYKNFNAGDRPYKEYVNRNIEAYPLTSYQLKIINHTETDAVVMLVNRKKKVVDHVYVPKDVTYTMTSIPEGEYIINVMYGNKWDANKSNGKGKPGGGFTEDVSYSRSKWTDSFDFHPQKTIHGTEYPQYSVTLHRVKNGNMQTETISNDAFFY